MGEDQCYQPLCESHTAHPFENPYSLQPEIFEIAQPFQNPYILQLESLQIPQPFQNPYILQHESLRTEQPLQTPNNLEPDAPQRYPNTPVTSLNGFQEVQQQQHQDLHLLQGRNCGRLSSPEYARDLTQNRGEHPRKGCISNSRALVVDSYG